MNKEPKQFILYWTSQFAGTKPRWTTEKFKANMKTFDDYSKAKATYEKLLKCKQTGELYGSRKVYHVGHFE